jgi:hypothetical protein
MYYIQLIALINLNHMITTFNNSPNRDSIFDSREKLNYDGFLLGQVRQSFIIN